MRLLVVAGTQHIADIALVRRYTAHMHTAFKHYSHQILKINILRKLHKDLAAGPVQKATEFFQRLPRQQMPGIHALAPLIILPAK